MTESPSPLTMLLSRHIRRQVPRTPFEKGSEERFPASKVKSIGEPSARMWAGVEPE